MYKTVTEIADELSISRQAVHQAVDKLLDKRNLRKKGNAFMLDSREQGLIYEYFNHRPKDTASSSSSESSSRSSSSLITSLQQQNEFLMQELSAKNKQISELHILLLKEKESYKLLEAEAETAATSEPKKKKWYHFFR